MEPSVIAERQLQYATKGGDQRRSLIVKIHAPREAAAVGYQLDGGASICTVKFEGLPGVEFDVHGIDTVHALLQAADIDHHLRNLSTKYDFFWASGEPYFDAENGS